VDRAEGVYFYTPDGKRYLDFNSQLMGVNIGHGDKRVIAAITRQAEKLAYISPFMATEARAVLGQKMAQILPGDIEKVFFTLGGAEANENAIRMARAVTGRQKILARYRSYHGSTSGAISLTGDPRRWPNEPGIPGVIHVLDPYHGPDRPSTPPRRHCAISRRRSSSKDPTQSPRSFSSRSRGPTGSSSRRTAI
jgi:taurine--2-oxoglutarate transaminase